MWSECSARCGAGSRVQFFSVEVAAANGGADGTCEAADGESKSEPCEEAPCAVDCAGSWGEWSVCTEPCAGGIQTKTYVFDVSASYIHAGD